ncbi:MAG: hypothetical protein KGH69_02670 [Candidatus Micrarchaeota archaeon]|nr:hypothetical protein [Candidatus Micrarchaeota archaeon]
MRVHFGNNDVARVLVPATKWGAGASGIAAALSHGQKPIGMALSGILGLAVRGLPEIIRIRDERRGLDRLRRS